MPPEPTVAAPDVRTDLSLALENNAAGILNEKVQVPADLTNALLSLDQEGKEITLQRLESILSS